MGTIRKVNTVDDKKINLPHRKNHYEALLTITDSAEKKQAEMALCQSRANLRTIVNNSDTAYLLLDNELNIVTSNSIAKRWALEYIHVELIPGECLIDLIPSFMRVHVHVSLLSVMAGTKTEYETNIPNPDGTLFWCHFKINCVYDDHGNAQGLCIAVSDISVRKKAEQQIRELNESLERKIEQRTTELEQAYKELESFSFMVSHDLQSPLRVVSGLTAMLNEDYGPLLDDTGQEHIAAIHLTVTRMNQLIKQLLAFARSTHAPLVRHEVNMTEVCRIILSEVRSADPGLRAHVDLHDLGTAHCDWSLIKQVWSNLILNAIKYSGKEEQPVVEIGVLHKAGEQVYYVRDNGVGFDMKHAGKLFTVFKRLHSESEFEGTGVGLAVVQRILTRHGGRIWAEAVQGQGATFYFTLPDHTDL